MGSFVFWHIWKDGLLSLARHSQRPRPADSGSRGVVALIRRWRIADCHALDLSQQLVARFQAEIVAGPARNPGGQQVTAGP